MYASETVSTASYAQSSDAAKTAQIVVELLRAGLKTLDTNREAATKYLSKACVILETAGIRRSTFDEDAIALVRGGLAPWQMQRIKAYIEANLDKPVTAKELSAVVRLGPSHFQRAFKKCFGVGPHTFVVDRRVKRAQELMLATDEPLCEIALAAGFADQSHLTKTFHNAVGVTPSVWRRHRRGSCETQNSFTRAAKLSAA
jgi:transcriptional regulator GlxA family with amidase domain